MCEFISWVEKEDSSVVFLTDADLKDRVIRGRIEGARGTDVIGHGAIRAAFPGLVGTNREYQCFWKSERFPEAIRQYLTDPQTLLKTWGKMLAVGLRIEELRFIRAYAPSHWCDPITAFLVNRRRGNDPEWAYEMFRNTPNLTGEQRILLIKGMAKDPEWAHHALRNIRNLTGKQKALLIEGAAKGTRLAFYTLLLIPNLTDEQRALLIEGAAKDPEWAHNTLRSIRNLTGKQKALLIGCVAKDPEWANYTLLLIPNLTDKQKNLLRNAA